MEALFPFFLVLFIGVFFFELLGRLFLPWVVTLILGGIIVGPHVLDLFTPNETVEFVGQIGLVYLMFLAGLEVKLSNLKKWGKNVFTISAINSFIPFVIGLGIGLWFEYSIEASLLLGIIFMSSSIAVVIPSLEDNGILQKKLGKTIVGSTIISDLVSLVLLSFFLQSFTPTTSLPLPLFYVLLIAFLVVVRWFLPVVRLFFSKHIHGRPDPFKQELRSIFVILLGTVFVFEILGLHPIIGGFFTGLVLSDSIKGNMMISQLRSIGYSIFIPTFFVIIGTETNIGVFFEATTAIWLIVAIIFGSVFSKLLSGYFAGKMTHFKSTESWLIGASTIPQLSTSLAVAFSGFELGIIDEKMITAMVILSIVTTIIAPILIRAIHDIIYPKEKTFKQLLLTKEPYGKEKRANT